MVHARKLNIIEKFWLRLHFPKIPKESDTYISIRKTDYQLMKNIIERQEKYITQIRKQNKEIEELKYTIKEKEFIRKKLAGKIGGMQKYINRLKGDDSERL